MENHFNAPSKSTTVSNIIFLLLSFPLGLCYFLMTVIGLSLGIGTLVIWIGLPILFTTLFLIRVMAEVERRMISSLLRLPLSYRLPKQDEPRISFLRRFGKVLADPYTWTSTIYMILKLPLGILNFVLALTLPIVSAALTLMPLVYLINLFIDLILIKSGVPISDSGSIIIPSFIEVHGSFDLVMFARSFVGVPIGLVLWFITRYVLNVLALGSGELACALLGPGEFDKRASLHQSDAPPMVMQEQRVYTE